MTVVKIFLAVVNLKGINRYPSFAKRGHGSLKNGGHEVGRYHGQKRRLAQSQCDRSLEKGMSQNWKTSPEPKPKLDKGYTWYIS